MAEPLAGTFRRLAAAAYDGLLLLAVLLLVSALLLPLTHGEAIVRARVGALEYGYQALLALCVFAYYATAWTRRGQTLGMKAWSIRVETAAGALPRLREVAMRLAVAAPLYLLAIAGVLLLMFHRAGAIACGLLAVPLVASYAWHLATRRGTLHDRLSGTRVVLAAAPPPAAA